MFKIIMRMAVLSSLLALSWSCEVYEYNNKSRSSSNFVYFGERLVRYSSESSVTLLTRLVVYEERVNVEGYTYTYYSDDNLVLDVVWLADNCWEVSGANEIMNFTLQVERGPSETLEDDYKWTVSSFSLNYDESNGYSAVMTTEGDLVYDWRKYSTYTSREWVLLQSGTYYLESFISGVGADSCILRYYWGTCTSESYQSNVGSGLPDGI